MQENLSFMGLRIKNLQINEAACYLHIQSQLRRTHCTAFLNADCVNKFEDLNYTKALSKMDYLFSDGVGMKIGHWLFGQQIVDNVNGTDIFPLLLTKCNKSQSRIYFFGSKKSVVKTLVEQMKLNYPGINIVGYSSGYISKGRQRKMIREISRLNVDYLFVGLGAPIQEKWMDMARKKMKVGVVIGVGGLFDFFSGKIKRAPQWIRRIKLEWIYRLYQEPKRLWKRYILGNPKFIYKIIMSRIKRRYV